MSGPVARMQGADEAGRPDGALLVGAGASLVAETLRGSRGHIPPGVLQHQGVSALLDALHLGPRRAMTAADTEACVMAIKVSPRPLRCLFAFASSLRYGSAMKCGPNCHSQNFSFTGAG